MDDRTLIGWVLVGAGVLDLATGLLVLRPRLPERSRGVVVPAVVSSGVLIAGLGMCFLAGVL